MVISMVGMLASSKAGHDKGLVYVIISEDAEYVYLADGKLRTVAKPKKKNKKHIQIIKKCPDLDLAEKVRHGLASDVEVRKLIKIYMTDSIVEENGR
ncbi:MAG: hypothetical protein NC433_02730 [Clostridiales bacterium]|nr:hypothetical protein [Clostridiales bacterium]